MFAAIKSIENKDEIISGLNHWECFEELFKRNGVSDANDGFLKFSGLYENGFVDENNNWYSREDAMKIAAENDLIRPDMDMNIQDDIDFHGGLVAEALKPEVRKIQK